MVLLPDGYCIDSTEVTQTQYRAWLASHPALPDATDDDCGWNTTYAPACTYLPRVCQGAACDSFPQVCVDWCDAYAYCRAVGKRLCGKIGGGPSEINDYGNASLSQWYNACSSHGALAYPYGDTLDETACNGSTDAPMPVGSLPRCQSPVPGYQGVFDLSGNVLEWVDSCSEAGQSGGCGAHGGDFGGAEPCAAFPFTPARDSAAIGLGFRCCSSP